VQIMVDKTDKTRNYLQNPYFFVVADTVQLNTDGSERGELPSCTGLLGTVVSSLNKLRDTESEDGGFFIFSDICVKHEGHYRLRFTLFEINQKRNQVRTDAAEVTYITSVWSDKFTVYGVKDFPGLLPSTPLSRVFCEQGVRLKLRKETRHVAQSEKPTRVAAEPQVPAKSTAPWPGLVVRTERSTPHFHPYPARGSMSSSYSLSNSSPSTGASTFPGSAGLYTPPLEASSAPVDSRYGLYAERHGSFPPQAWMATRTIADTGPSVPTEYRNPWQHGAPIQQNAPIQPGSFEMGPPDIRPDPRLRPPVPLGPVSETLPPIHYGNQSSADQSAERLSLRLPPLFFPPSHTQQ
jgi:hypothetical protein